MAAPHEVGPHPWVVLHVDDDEGVLETVRQLVERTLLGVHVISAGKAATALQMLRHERVDLIVADFRMPEMNGVELLFAAQRLRPGIPVVIFSAFGDEPLVQQAVAGGLAAECIDKGADLDQFLERIEFHLGYVPPKGPLAVPS
ncbi:MAG: response regulator [Thermoplasmatota archaeon]